MTETKTDDTTTEEKEKGNDYDSAWKEVIEKLFDPFIAFFFPVIHGDIDFTKPIEFLNDELRQIDPNNKLGKRLSDALVKVHLKKKPTDGTKKQKSKCIWVLIHIEIEGNPRNKFMERMFIYHYRIYDRLTGKGIKVVSLGILTDEEKNFRPSELNIRQWGFQLNLKIPIVKITDYKFEKNKIKELETSKNPMAMVVRAQLKCHEIKGSDDDKKYAVKCELLRECRKANYGSDETRVLFKFIGWVIRLPKLLESKLIQEINKIEEGTKMQYIPVRKKKAWDEGIEKGIEKGKLSTARRLLEEGVDAEIIAVATEFPIEDIRRLAGDVQTS
ncbi:MAG: hypothetical protein GY757_14990 [bacterium]|nr:hypothetical protein [bacterium]